MNLLRGTNLEDVGFSDLVFDNVSSLEISAWQRRSIVLSNLGNIFESRRSNAIWLVTVERSKSRLILRIGHLQDGFVCEYENIYFIQFHFMYYAIRALFCGKTYWKHLI